MAWPRIKNSRSSAQPGTHPHDGVQAIVTPAPDAEPPPGSGYTTGVSGTRHTVARDSGGYGPGTDNPSADRPQAGRRLRPIRYAHSAANETADSADPVGTAGEAPAPAASPGTAVPDPATSGTQPPGTVLSGTVVSGPVPTYGEPDDYDTTAGLVYEVPRPAYSGPAGPMPPEEPADPMPPEEPVEPVASQGPVSNEGLGIFGDVKTTEVPDEDTPAEDFEPQPGPEPTRVIPIGAAWNQPIAATPVAGDGVEGGKPNPFERVRKIWAGQPVDDDTPRVMVRDLPPDVQMRLYRIRATIMVIVGVGFFILTRNWAIALTLAILAGIVDTVYRSRNAAMYRNGAAFPGARKATIKQLRKLRRDGYLSLDARPIPNSREFIDHLVIGPTGVYAIDSEKWNPRLPVRTWNGKKLYHGPESQKDRLEHAAWEASQASEILSGALGFEVKVQPALAIYGPKIPWDIATIRDVDVFTGSALRKYLKRRSRMKDGVVQLTREEIRTIYETASRVLPDVAQTYTPVG